MVGTPTYTGFYRNATPCTKGNHPDAAWPPPAHEALDSPADIEIAFVGGRMSKIAVSFSQAPPLTDVIAEYEKRFGRPAVKRLATQAYGTSTIRWETPQRGQVLTTTVTDHQGSMRIVFERK